MKTRSLLFLALLALAVTLQAQPQRPRISVEGGTPDDRGSSRMLYWDSQSDSAAGQLVINYGRPLWKKDYEDPAKFDKMTKGQVWRLGSNFWTELVTDLPLNIAGNDIAPGDYYLGLYRSEDGASWSLAFINPAQARKAHLDAFDIRKAQIEFKVPMSTGKADRTAEKLTITLSHPPNAIKDVTMKVAWGNLVVSAPVKVTLPE